MIEGISHITFIVRDLEKSSEFFRYVFDAQEIYASHNQTFSIAREKFFLVNQLWIALMEGEPVAPSYNHVAFKIADSELDTYTERVQKTGVEIKKPRPRIEGEGTSFYFYDFDNHLFELHTGTLDQRLQCYKKPAIQREAVP